MIDIVVWILAALVALGVAALVTLWAAGRFAKLKRGKPSSMLPAGDDTALDARLEPLERANQGLSAARLVPEEPDALALRLALARQAERSLDLMYYIWEDDLCGRLLAQAVLEAADRGVRVRMLLDDVNLIKRDPAYRALDRHPKIEVRLFNPIRNRDRGILRGLELLFNLLPYNRRMHNKLMIADARLALTGGRNIGDHYFGANRGDGVDYDDLDVLLAGMVLRDTGELFDRFWNSGVALPIRTLWVGKTSRLRRFRRRLQRFLDQPESRRSLERLRLPSDTADPQLLKLDAMRWVKALEFVADPPDKALGGRREGWMPAALVPLLSSATRELRIMTPYLVPGSEGLSRLIALQKSGVQVEIITNGLRRSDSILVYGAYRWYRPRLIEAGIRVLEAATPGEPDTMLHAKAFIVDGERAFVGSFNFDQRSAFLNTELGIIFEDEGLIGELTGLFDTACAPGKAWCVTRDGFWLRWTRGDETTRYEPGTNAFKRGMTFLIGHLPIHRFL